MIAIVMNILLVLLLFAVIVWFVVWFVKKVRNKNGRNKPNPVNTGSGSPPPLLHPKPPIDKINDFIKGVDIDRKQQGRNAAMSNHEDSHKQQNITAIIGEGKLLCDTTIKELEQKIIQIDAAISEYTRIGQNSNAKEKEVEKQQYEKDIDYIKNKKTEIEINTNLPVYCLFSDGFAEGRNAKMKAQWG
ncbi:MAG: hypothetical protein LBG92_10250 [Prevotellaceae bacterium]|jgi:hypothetical protein|nr:hypothetical protein [Prevotellaceae bacterium]